MNSKQLIESFLAEEKQPSVVYVTFYNRREGADDFVDDIFSAADQCGCEDYGQGGGSGEWTNEFAGDDEDTQKFYDELNIIRKNYRGLVIDITRKTSAQMEQEEVEGDQEDRDYEVINSRFPEGNKWVSAARGEVEKAALKGFPKSRKSRRGPWDEEGETDALDFVNFKKFHRMAVTKRGRKRLGLPDRESGWSMSSALHHKMAKKIA
jgi:hypothetical protein